MSIKLEEAIEAVEEYLAANAEEMNVFGSALPGYENPNIRLKILTDRTEEHSFGWIFYYDSSKHIETGDLQDALAGNAPLIVNRSSGELVETGTARESRYYVTNYIRPGDPHKECG